MQARFPVLGLLKLLGLLAV